MQTGGDVEETAELLRLSSFYRKFENALAFPQKARDFVEPDPAVQAVGDLSYVPLSCHVTHH
jgi:hypothetical protein